MLASSQLLVAWLIAFGAAWYLDRTSWRRAESRVRESDRTSVRGERRRPR